jgi:hypothetical protein
MRIVALFILALYGTFAAAEFEFKAHYGQLMSKPSSFNKDMESSMAGFPDVGSVTLMGADALYSLPILSFAFGVRYEMLDFKKSGTLTAVPVEIDTELTGSRISVLGGYRLIETPIGYIGLLAHYAVSQEMKYDIKVAGGSETKTKASMDSSFGAGVDAAITLSYLVIGAEVGYTMLKAKDLKDADGDYLGDSSGKKSSMDLSGTYFKVMIGVSI